MKGNTDDWAVKRVDAKVMELSRKSQKPLEVATYLSKSITD